MLMIVILGLIAGACGGAGSTDQASTSIHRSQDAPAAIDEDDEPATTASTTVPEPEDVTDEVDDQGAASEVTLTSVQEFQDALVEAGLGCTDFEEEDTSFEAIEEFRPEKSFRCVLDGTSGRQLINVNIYEDHAALQEALDIQDSWGLCDDQIIGDDWLLFGDRDDEAAAPLPLDDLEDALGGSRVIC